MTGFKSTSDNQLALGIKNGEKIAFQNLFERYASNIHFFALSYLQNEQDAEELVQEVFMKIWEKKENIDFSKSIKAYIYKIAINTIYDFIRHKNISNSFKEFIIEANSIKSNNTWDTIIFDEMILILEKLILQMPVERQKIFRLSKEKGMTNEEIAQHLKLSKRTVENQLYRAILFLKKNFKYNSIFFTLLICLLGKF